MPDLWKHFRRTHKPAKSDSEDSDEGVLVQDIQNLRITTNGTGRKDGDKRKSPRADTAAAANGLARLTVTPQQPPVGRVHSDQPWVGGFSSLPSHSSQYQRAERPQYHGNVSSAPAVAMPTPTAYPNQPHMQSHSPPPGIPIIMPIPSHLDAPYSLTMQHAVLGTQSPQYPNESTYPDTLRPSTPTIPPRPHSDPARPPSSYSPISTPGTGPSTPRRQKKADDSFQPSQSVPAKLTKANLTSLNTSSPTPKRRRAASTPPTPVSASVVGSTTDDTVQCSAITKQGHRCKNKVAKLKTDLAKLDPELNSQIERFCSKHTKALLNESMVRVNSQTISFDEYLPAYLQPATAAFLRAEMSKPPSDKDQHGFIYTFQIVDTSDKAHVHLKVGRAVKLTKRIDEWSKQCGSKTQLLCGWWPRHQDTTQTSLLKGTVKSGPPGLLCHKLERLVHLELADLSINAPYLDANWPNLTYPPFPNQNPLVRVQCADCGAVHQEIFKFKSMNGRNKGKEYELLVKPVVAKWGEFLEKVYGDKGDDSSD